MAEPSSNFEFDWHASLPVQPQLPSSVAVPLRTTSPITMAISSTHQANAQPTAAVVTTAPIALTHIGEIAATTIAGASMDPPRLSVKFPDLSTTSSSSEDDQDVVQSHYDGQDCRKSPPPNCAICLGRCKNKCFTDSCMHQFCFKCLCEWSKVKPECPLCKQTFKAIIHNVKSMDQFEEYLVQPAVPQRQEHSLQWRLPSGYTSTRFDFYFEEMIMNHATIHALTNEARPPRAIPRSASTTSTSSVSGINSAAYNHRAELLHLYGQEYPDAMTITNSSLSQLWRRYVYDRKLFALPVFDVTGRFRESSSRFYRDNPAQIHRLMPWISRDLRCLLRNTEHSVPNLLELINDALKVCNILSPAFRRRLQSFLGLRTSHFIHELSNFARSPYDMIGYDRVVQYSPQSAEEIFIDFSSSSSWGDPDLNVDGVTVNVDDSDSGGGAVAATSTMERSDQNNQNRRDEPNNTPGTLVGATQPINILSFAVSSTSEGTEATTVTSAPTRTLPSLLAARATTGHLQAAAINLSTHNRRTGDEHNDLYGFLNIELFSDDEGRATLPNSGLVSAASVERPRTPPINNNSSVVVLSLSSSGSECEFVLEQKPPHLRTPEMVSLNSDSDSDVVFVNETFNPEISAAIPKLTTRKRRTQQRDAQMASFTYSTSSGSEYNGGKPTKKAKSYAKKLSKRGGDNNMEEEAMKEEEYNVGASTSKGLRSSVPSQRERGRSLGKRRRQGRLRRLSKTSTSNCLRSNQHHKNLQRLPKKVPSHCDDSSDNNNDDTSDEDKPLIRYSRLHRCQSNCKLSCSTSEDKNLMKTESDSNINTPLEVKDNNRQRKATGSHCRSQKRNSFKESLQTEEAYDFSSTSDDDHQTLERHSSSNLSLGDFRVPTIEESLVGARAQTEASTVAFDGASSEQQVQHKNRHAKVEHYLEAHFDSQTKTEPESQRENAEVTESTDSESVVSSGRQSESDSSSSVTSMSSDYTKDPNNHKERPQSEASTPDSSRQSSTSVNSLPHTFSPSHWSTSTADPAEGSEIYKKDATESFGTMPNYSDSD